MATKTKVKPLPNSSAAKKNRAFEFEGATPLTENERAVLAAVFARTNMGLPDPSAEKIAYATMNLPGTSQRLGRQPVANDWVVFFCSEFMESDEHEAMFNSEADGWWIEFGKRGQNTREYVTKTWPEVGALFGWAT